MLRGLRQVVHCRGSEDSVLPVSICNWSPARILRRSRNRVQILHSVRSKAPFLHVGWLIQTKCLGFPSFMRRSPALVHVITVRSSSDRKTNFSSFQTLARPDAHASISIPRTLLYYHLLAHGTHAELFLAHMVFQWMLDRSDRFISIGPPNRSDAFTDHTIQICAFIDAMLPIAAGCNRWLGGLDREFHLGSRFRFSVFCRFRRRRRVSTLAWRLRLHCQWRWEAKKWELGCHCSIIWQSPIFRHHSTIPETGLEGGFFLLFELTMIE